MEIEEKVTVERSFVPGKMFPTFRQAEWGLVLAVLALVVVLLPQILMKLYAMSLKAQASLTQNSLVFSPVFSGLTLLFGLVLAVCAMVFHRNVWATKVIALLALIVALLKFVLPI